MIDTKVELHKYIHIADGYGGSKIVPVLVRKLNGKMIPVKYTETIDGAKKSFRAEAKFICDSRVDPLEGQLIKYGVREYSITSVSNIHNKGCVLGLVQIG